MKLTKWFKSHQTPKRVGVYQTRIFLGKIGYSYWNGRSWEWQEWSVEDAYSCYKKRYYYTPTQDKEWRGLTTKDGK